MLGLHLTGAIARVIMPEIGEGFNTDSVMPLLAMDLFPVWLVGIFMAAPLAAIMSTVDSQLILMSSTIMRDLYTNYINPKSSVDRVKALSMITTAILGLITIIAALNPPSLIIWINLFAFGGLEATFFWVLILGLYWKRANGVGAIASMAVGITSFLLISELWPRPFGTHPIVLTMILGLVAFVVATYASAPPKDETIEKFWGY
jgi:sodium/pantothenate symporter